MTDGPVRPTPDAVPVGTTPDAVATADVRRPASDPTPVCATCGALAAHGEAAALARITWSRGVDNGRDVWTCATCSRRHLRSLEGKLDTAWW